MNVNKKTTVSKEETAAIKHLKDSYNELVYPSKSFGVTSINSLEAKAKLWGLNPVPAKEARVLELGCSMGGNIIGQAVYHPEASFVGVDLSGSQIEIGNEIIEAIDLKNVKLLEQRTLELAEMYDRLTGK